MCRHVRLLPPAPTAARQFQLLHFLRLVPATLRMDPSRLIGQRDQTADSATGPVVALPVHCLHPAPIGRLPHVQLCHCLYHFHAAELVAVVPNMVWSPFGRFAVGFVEAEWDRTEGQVRVRQAGQAGGPTESDWLAGWKASSACCAVPAPGTLHCPCLLATSPALGGGLR